MSGQGPSAASLAPAATTTTTTSTSHFPLQSFSSEHLSLLQLQPVAHSHHSLQRAAAPSLCPVAFQERAHNQSPTR